MQLPSSHERPDFLATQKGKMVITYFPKVAQFPAPCQFCGVEADLLSKSKEGKWVTTCPSCFGEKQGVRPVRHHDGKRFITGISLATRTTHTIFECEVCKSEVAYVKGKKGYYLAHVNVAATANYSTEGRRVADWVGHSSFKGDAGISPCEAQVARNVEQAAERAKRDTNPFVAPPARLEGQA